MPSKYNLNVVFTKQNLAYTTQKNNKHKKRGWHIANPFIAINFRMQR